MVFAHFHIVRGHRFGGVLVFRVVDDIFQIRNVFRICAISLGARNGISVEQLEQRISVERIDMGNGKGALRGRDAFLVYILKVSFDDFMQNEVNKIPV